MNSAIQKKGTYYYLGKVSKMNQLWKALCDRLRSLGMPETEIAKNRSLRARMKLGTDHKRITNIDADGVALAAHPRPRLDRQGTGCAHRGSGEAEW